MTTTSIEIVKGPQAGTAFDATGRTCFRVGSAASCEFGGIRGLDSHALTVHQDEEAYRVINRSSQGVRLDGHELNPGEDAIWKPERSLMVNEQCVLVLKQSGWREPKPMPSELTAPDIAPEEEQDRLPKWMVRMMAGLLTLFVLVFLVARAVQLGDAMKTTREFNEIVSSLQEVNGNMRVSYLLRTLQTARSLELQGRAREAAVTYADIRRKCMRDLGNPQGNFRTIEIRANEFITQRIAWLEAQSRSRSQ